MVQKKFFLATLQNLRFHTRVMSRVSQYRTRFYVFAQVHPSKNNGETLFDNRNVEYIRV
jgi:hypothetical protein